MSLRVTLNVFSGRPNPSWLLTDAQETDLRSRLDDITTHTLQKPPGVMGRLGFRGFSLFRSPTDHAGGLSLYIHEGIVDRGQEEENLSAGSRELERWLLNTQPDILSAEVLKHVNDQFKQTPFDIISYNANRIKGSFCPACVAADAPPYQPMRWNIPSVQPYNNCYNYANDQITGTFAQPGRAHGAPGCDHGLSRRKLSGQG